MDFTQLYDFLERLQKNNHKEWMDQHRKEYHHVRDFFISWLEEMNLELARIDDSYTDTPGKKAINRINNNLLYHPNKPVYKDHFGAGLDQLSKQGDFYIEIGVNENMIAGGYWYPPSKMLRSIRDAIDYNGDEFKEILNKKSFQKTFGAMLERGMLTNAPKGFSADHPHIDLLRQRSFAVGCYLSREEVCRPDFNQKVIAVYKEMLPFRRYLNQAVTV